MAARTTRLRRTLRNREKLSANSSRRLPGRASSQTAVVTVTVIPVVPGGIGELVPIVCVVAPASGRAGTQQTCNGGSSGCEYGSSVSQRVLGHDCVPAPRMIETSVSLVSMRPSLTRVSFVTGPEALTLDVPDRNGGTGADVLVDVMVSGEEAGQPFDVENGISNRTFLGPLADDHQAFFHVPLFPGETIKVVLSENFLGFPIVTSDEPTLIRSATAALRNSRRNGPVRPLLSTWSSMHCS